MAKVTFEVRGFPKDTALGVVLWPTEDRNDPADHVCLKGIPGTFRSDASGRATIKFTFSQGCRFPNGATGGWSYIRWRGGQRVDVRVYDPRDLDRYAIKVVRVVRSGAPKRLTIPTTARKAIFRARCALARPCRARVRISAGKKTLARGRYSVPAHSNRKVGIPLTKAGRTTLRRRHRAPARLTVVDTRTHRRSTVAVVLRRRG